MKYILMLLMMSAVLGFSGCILSPDDEVPIEQPKAVWKDLTNQEDVITNLVLSYKYRDINHYEELLHEDYLWYNQIADVQGGAEEYWERAEEVTKVGNMFQAAKLTYPDQKLWLDRLDLWIADGAWQPADSVNGEACSTCWTTQREYSIQLVFKEGDLTVNGNDNVEFAVKGVEKDGKTIYQLIRADDIKK